MLLFNLPNPTLSYNSSYTQFHSSDFHFSTVAAKAIDKAVASAARLSPGGSSIRAETVEINAAPRLLMQGVYAHGLRAVGPDLAGDRVELRLAYTFG